jgi:nitroimidazol reductase NimA-like FMN-containing flavoprotein (pyridoxamine 5'-phosphate oxidase superfamily)
LRLTDEELDELLATEKTLRAATVSEDGSPHVVPLWFIWHDGAIWLNSLRRSRRQSDLAAGSKVALCVDAGDTYWELKGAVLYGTPVEATDDAMLAEARKAFAFKNWGIEDLPPEIKSHVWLKVVPEKIVSWDFKKIPAGKDPRVKYGPKPPDSSTG